MGIAVSDPLNIIAQGVKVIEHSSQTIREIKQTTEEFDIDTIVVGMPLNLKGEKGIKALEVEGFITNLKEELGLEIIGFDERFTTHTAQQTLRVMGVKKKKRKNKETIDQMAAALILQGYLDSKNHEHRTPI